MQAYAAVGNLVTRYFTLQQEWASYVFIASLPNNADNPNIRIGQCRAYGTLLFDDIEVRPALPVHRRIGQIELGSGESFRSALYSFQPDFTSFQCNYSRPLHEATARFGSDRWLMANGTYVQYRHELSGLAFTNAQLIVTVDYWINGELILETCADGTSWQELGRVKPASTTSTTVFQTNLPSALFPATEVFVRLRATGDLWVSKYKFEGGVPGGPLYEDGKTGYFEAQVPGTAVHPMGISESPSGYLAELELRNPSNTNRTFSVVCESQGPAGTRQSSQVFEILAVATNRVTLKLPTAGVGENTVSIGVADALNGEALFSGALQLFFSAIQDDSYGALFGGSEACAVWWCEATHKVGRERPPPGSTPEQIATNRVEITAARNEYEPFQVVLRPEIPLTNVQIAMSDLLLEGFPGTGVSSTNVEICLVEYVPVTLRSDYFGTPGAHPDPLVPVKGGLDLEPGRNQPFWFTVYVPWSAPPGDYHGTVQFYSDDLNIVVPVRLRVHRFAIPDVTHLSSAYNVRIDPHWHGCTDAEAPAIWDLYMQNLRKHRVSPYAAQQWAPITWTFANGQFSVNFTNFDAAMERYLDEFDFSRFNVIDLPHYIGGHPRFTPEYRALLAQLMKPILAHLREKGWLEKAYCFWIDEPSSTQLPYALQGMAAVQEAAPELRRLVTTFPEPVLYNQVETWVSFFGIYEFLQSRTDARRAAGDEFWSYVCTGPKAPNPNNFIDHPAMSHRIRSWMAERSGFTGELYWNVSWFRGLNNETRDPWADAMSIAYAGWAMGNGDGVLVYPPAKTPPLDPLIANPLNSLRWELIREGYEDFEYFWLLRQAIEKGLLKFGAASPEVLNAYRAYEAAMAVTSSATSFDKMPENLMYARLAVAEAIDALEDGTPFLVRQPLPRIVQEGAPVIFRTEALGWPVPAYQWRFNGNEIAGATNSALRIESVGLSNAGSYSVVASNAAGVALSEPAILAVKDASTGQAPEIVAQPKPLVRTVGGNAVFDVTASGSPPLSYQWFFNGTRVLNATNAALAMTNVSTSNTGSYHVIITNSSGAATSTLATLSLPAIPRLTASPSTNPAGIMLSFSAYNRAGRVQWSPNLVTWEDLVRLLPAPDPIRLVDVATTNETPRFYRVVIDP